MYRLATATRWLLLTLLLGALEAQADCPTGRLESAFFSLSPQVSQAIEQDKLTLSAHTRLYAYSLTLAQGDSILHRWYHNNRLVSSQTLATGQGQWQAWSSIRPDTPSGHWRVEVMNGDHCRLGRIEINLQPSDKVLAQAKRLIASGDIVGAKLTLKTALNNRQGSRSQRHQRQVFLARELALAEIKNDIKQQQFLAARGRLQALEDTLSGHYRAQRDTLEQLLQAAQRVADQHRLVELKSSIRLLSLSLTPCPDNLQQAKALLQAQLEKPLYLTHFSRMGQLLQLQVTLPSGQPKRIGWQCPAWPL